MLVVYGDGTVCGMARRGGHLGRSVLWPSWRAFLLSDCAALLPGFGIVKVVRS
jgi:hypothetical protein